MDKSGDKNTGKDTAESVPPPDPGEVLRRMLETLPKPRKVPRQKPKKGGSRRLSSKPTSAT